MNIDVDGTWPLGDYLSLSLKKENNTLKVCRNTFGPLNSLQDLTPR